MYSLQTRFCMALLAALLLIFEAPAYISVQIVSSHGDAEIPTGSTTKDGDCLRQESYGCDIGGDCNVEHFQYAYIKIKGDFDVSMKVEEMTAGTSDDGGYDHKCGIMARSGEEVDAKAVFPYMFSPGSRNTADFEFRDCSKKTKNACWFICSEEGNGYQKPFPRWLRLARTNTLFKGSYSFDGSEWFPIGYHNAWTSQCSKAGELTMEMPEELLVGVATSSYDWWNNDHKWHIVCETKTCDFKGWALGKEGELYGGSPDTGAVTLARNSATGAWPHAFSNISLRVLPDKKLLVSSDQAGAEIKVFSPAGSRTLTVHPKGNEGVLPGVIGRGIHFISVRENGVVYTRKILVR
jgi:hypothetical protein